MYKLETYYLSQLTNKDIWVCYLSEETDDLEYAKKWCAVGPTEGTEVGEQWRRAVYHETVIESYMDHNGDDETIVDRDLQCEAKFIISKEPRLLYSEGL